MADKETDQILPGILYSRLSFLEAWWAASLSGVLTMYYWSQQVFAKQRIPVGSRARMLIRGKCRLESPHDTGRGPAHNRGKLTSRVNLVGVFIIFRSVLENLHPPDFRHQLRLPWLSPYVAFCFRVQDGAHLSTQLPVFAYRF
jgi:hypothetical protein